MKNKHPVPTALILLTLSALLLRCGDSLEPAGEEGISAKMLPHEWMYAQRAYPHHQINLAIQQEAYRQTQAAKRNNHSRLAGSWENAGPTNIGGRVTDIALHPTNQNIIYLGTTAGGVYKSVDKGATWAVIFEEEGAMSIGNIAIAPSVPNTLYVGSGEANGELASGALFGDGIYKSTDGGATWTFKGLHQTQHIGRIVVDPQNADRVYVAAAGLLYGKNQERGLYRTTNGGDTWEQVLFVSDSTSCIDVVVHPQNANILYAATWERIRRPWGRQFAGMTSRIYKSVDSGNTWTKLTNGLPADSPETGRIGLAISPSNPNIVYAMYTSHPTFNYFAGIYKTVNGGDSWTRVDENLNANLFTFGWFLGNLRVHPTKSEDVSLLGVWLYRSLNGGKIWQNATLGMHVDFHALEFHPQNPDFIVAGNDGGVYISQNGGFLWEKKTGIANNLFYTCEIDPVQPQHWLGGTQDQGVLRTTSGAENDWEEILFGDGFQVIVDPTNNETIYAARQFGELYRSEFGGQDFTCIFNCPPNGIPGLRTNWNTPIVLHPANSNTLFYGAQQLYKSTDSGDSFFPISPDLTKGQHPAGSLSYGTITAIGLAASNEQFIYVGTDDGRVQMTADGGAFWKDISGGVPDRFVTAIAVDPTNPLVAYVALSGYRQVDYQPHILRTTDGGTQWTDISANLPEIPINDIVIHQTYPSVLFIANDLGVWYSHTSGQHWDIVGDNFPATVVNDLDLHESEQLLLAATYGRSMLKFDISQLEVVSTQTPAPAVAPLLIFPNPAKESVVLSFSLPGDARGSVQIFNGQGQLLQTMQNQNFRQGLNEERIGLKQLPAGQYLIRIQAGRQSFSGKLSIVK